MRIAIAALFSLIAVSAAAPAQADPYPWCAQYGGFGGGGVESCYYMTLEQCRASVAGIGGWCNRASGTTASRSRRISRSRSNDPASAARGAYHKAQECFGGKRTSNIRMSCRL